MHEEEFEKEVKIIERALLKVFYNDEDLILNDYERLKLRYAAEKSLVSLTVHRELSHKQYEAVGEENKPAQRKMCSKKAFNHNTSYYMPCGKFENHLGLCVPL